MPKEIERKFLVRDPSVIAGYSGEAIVQGYVAHEPLTTRVRLVNDTLAFLTLKDRPQGRTRNEYEYAIPLQDARELLAQAAGPDGGGHLEKIRYRIPVDDLVFEVDVFQGKLHGLVTAEVELQAEDQALTLPSWLGDEVSDDGRYANANLAKAARIPGAGAPYAEPTGPSEADRLNALREAFWNNTPPDHEDVAVLGDVLVDVLFAAERTESPTPAQIRAFFMLLPVEILGTALSWGFEDTDVREQTYEFATRNKGLIRNAWNT